MWSEGESVYSVKCALCMTSNKCRIDVKLDCMYVLA